MNPNDRVVVRLYDLGGGAYPFKGFIFKTSAGTLTVKDSANTQAVSACDGAIGHKFAADDKSEVEAYLDMPSTTGTVTVTVEIVELKMYVYKLTLDIEVTEPLEAWTQVGDDIDGSGGPQRLGYSVSMNTDGTRIATGHQNGIRVFQYDQTQSTGTLWKEMGSISGVSSYANEMVTVSISGEGTRVASGRAIYGASSGASAESYVYVHEWISESQSWTTILSKSELYVKVPPVISKDGTRVAYAGSHAGVNYVQINECQTDATPPCAPVVEWNLEESSPGAMALSADGNHLVVGFPAGEGYVQVYRNIDDSGSPVWMPMGSAMYEMSAFTTEFGTSVAISADGTRVVVGAPGYNGPDGSQTGGFEPYVQVYDWSDDAGGYWIAHTYMINMGQTTIGAGYFDYFFGQSVDISDDGSLIAVNAVASSRAGSNGLISMTMLYEYSATNVWKPKVDDIEDVRTFNMGTGTSTVSLSGDGKYVAIGAEYDWTGYGHVRVFKDPTGAASSSPSGSCSSSRATGGTVTTSGEYTIHTFTSSGTFKVTDSTLTAVDVLVVGGGGAGYGTYMGGGFIAGGGGGGGEVISDGGHKVSKKDYTVTVGDGGSNSTEASYSEASNGGSSEFNGLIADGGAYSSREYPGNGGSSGSGNPGGAGNIYSSGGGGGAGAPGGDAIQNGDESVGGNGRDGIQSDISGTATFYGGGGGGSFHVHTGGVGRQGGGGNGYSGNIAMGSQPGTPNTGGGGGGGIDGGSDYGGSGGSGVVIVRYMSATCSQSPSPSTPSPSAEDKKKQAETTRDSLLADISDTRMKAKAKLLADAAIAGVKVQKLSAKITAADEDTACSETFSKVGMSAVDGACVATAASSGKRRRLSAMAYDVELMFSASTVNDDALKAAELELKNNGVEGVMSQTSVDPIAELKTVPGVGTGKLQTFENEASAAAAATAAEAQTPPPPTPPPPPKPNLVLDDDDGTVGLVGKAGLLMATAFAILAM